ncbi:uncharacterized protein BJ171DRAFT_529470 [Polychytrium aggregatum]|uniref:uncharacterized protein n=1 Tax=Polychytrium aggregatum TaxID=110093 RepID=UPI0022FE650B|nr:uncharacterized protein BJ171DRAFT_529470 [Polychytrium aggregatum]KAI9193272.1 hypothetical protein BJ171DRAFT_529470 [Polychytrium aggregatum]
MSQQQPHHIYHLPITSPPHTQGHSHSLSSIELLPAGTSRLIVQACLVLYASRARCPARPLSSRRTEVALFFSKALLFWWLWGIPSFHLYFFLLFPLFMQFFTPPLLSLYLSIYLSRIHLHCPSLPLWSSQFHFIHSSPLCSYLFLSFFHSFVLSPSHIYICTTALGLWCHDFGPVVFRLERFHSTDIRTTLYLSRLPRVSLLFL